MTQIQNALPGFNPWWKREFNIVFRPRTIYENIKKFLPLPQMIALTGLRRVGKTTILQKIIEDAIQTGFDAQRILYFSFDEFKNVRIDEVLKTYEQMNNVLIHDGKFLLLFDEVQKINDWESQLKTIYDINKDRVKIIISGSESLFIRKKSKESLAGRLFEFEVRTISFQEFLVFKEKAHYCDNLKLYTAELRILMTEFTNCFGFPELIDLHDKTIIEKYVSETIVDQVVYKDIPGILPIQNPDVLATLLRIIRENPGACIEVQTIAQELGISRQTVSTYLLYLEKSFLVQKIYNYSKNAIKREKRLKKYYPAIISPRIMFSSDSMPQSRVLEWLIVRETNADFFWRDQYKNEVDIVLLKDNTTPIPIEIKYGKIEVKSMESFMKTFGVKKGYIVSSERADIIKVSGGEIHIIPAHIFLLETVKEL